MAQRCGDFAGCNCFANSAFVPVAKSDTLQVQTPKYRRCAMPKKLAPFIAQPEQALVADAGRVKRDRRTGKQLFTEIKANGYAGGYSGLTDFIREWRTRQGALIGIGRLRHAFIPLLFAFGEAFQFDWSEEGFVIGGIFYRMQVSHMKLCASRVFWLLAYPSQGHEMLFDAHTRSRVRGHSKALLEFCSLALNRFIYRFRNSTHVPCTHCAACITIPINTNASNARLPA